MPIGAPPPALAAMFPVVFGPAPFTGTPFYQPLSVVAPDRLTPPAAYAASFPYLFKPGKKAVPTVAQPLQPVAPWRVFGRPARAAYMPYLFKPTLKVAPIAPAIPGIGTLGAATFVLSLGAGTRVTYSWPTDVLRTYSGREQRVSMSDGRPRLRIEGPAFLRDAGDRDVRGTLMRAAAQGSTFTLALPFEALTLASDSTGTTCNVTSTARCDWALPGQRCVVLGRDGSTVLGIVQGATATTISIAVVDSTGHVTSSTLGNTGLAGGQIMPLLQVVLDPQQGFTRYPTAVGLWNIRATAVAFGWAGVDAMGVGASITTFTTGDAVAVASLVDADLLIWDRANEIAGTAQETLLAGTELVDMGGLPFTLGAQAAPDWAMPIRMRSASGDDWAYFKAFVRLLRGRQRGFGLPTHRADFTFLSGTADGSGIVIAGASVAGGGDYVSWFASGAYRRLVLTLPDGSIQYVAVLAAVDSGGGTSTLTLQGGFIGTVAKISLLEQVRLDSDDVAVAWDGHVFTADLTVRAAQDALTPPTLFMFDKVLPLTTFINVGNTYVELTFALGQSTVVNPRFVNGSGFDNPGHIGALTAVGGNIDGMVVCIPCHVTPANNQAIFFDHESALLPATSRLRNPGAAVASTLLGAITYRYNGDLQRWVMISAI